ncbi:hypothetical protein [Zavarzinia sp.]|uniref:hypothetical protein n=1 Tax=Zavarzinia sp. TaxID=2027920 RepID=UPI00356AF923
MSDAPIDWRGVERDYRLGQLYLAEIAESYGLSEAALRRRAKDEGWIRGGGDADLAARRGFEVARAHRRLLADLRETLGQVQQGLRDHLAAPTGPPEEGPFAAGAETVAGLVRALGTTAERLIRLERQAFGLDRSDQAGEQDGDGAEIRERLQGRLSRLAVGRDAGGLPEEPEPA